MLMRGLQFYMRSKPSLSYGRIGGEYGQRLTRITFAVIVKLSGLTYEIDRVLDELDAASIGLPDEKGTERDKAILEILRDDPNFEKILNSWVVASKMRIWLNGKKQSVISQLTNEKQSEEEQKAALAEADKRINAIVEKIVSKARFLLALA